MAKAGPATGKREAGHLLCAEVGQLEESRLNCNGALLIGASQAAELLGIGRSLFYSLHSSGRIGPMPIRLGRRALWSRRELAQWVAAECPPRVRWIAIKKGEK